MIVFPNDTSKNTIKNVQLLILKFSYYLNLAKIFRKDTIALNMKICNRFMSQSEYSNFRDSEI